MPMHSGYGPCAGDGSANHDGDSFFGERTKAFPNPLQEDSSHSFGMTCCQELRAVPLVPLTEVLLLKLHGMVGSF